MMVRGTLEHNGGNVRPAVSADIFSQVEESFQRSPKLYVRVAARNLGIPHATIHKILRNKIGIFSLKI